MLCATQHPGVVDAYLSEEISNHCVIGPFNPVLIPNAHISRFGVIPKHHQLNKWCLIADLSHLSGHSINNGIPKDLCSLTYISPCRPSPASHEVEQLSLYIDTCLPFGLRSVPKLFNILADLLTWILEHMGVSPIMHCFDNSFDDGPTGHFCLSPKSPSSPGSMPSPGCPSG